ncbi:HAD-IA family hydrolase [Paraferrimonas sp. SM1919]|uniref:HAD-IA family hydrolase n=1 Tax=Paraferrimonas sp. SM1919 TaxID=2662263 RepID=UPI0013D5A582|nr:HAD-IA family hydrolase [Paraferrimonas sp. SM1919]
MKCYKPLQQIKVISFDLDDNLYDNRPLLIAAEKKLRLWLAGHINTLPEMSFWTQIKQQCLESTPALANDISLIRQHTLATGLQILGKSKQQAERLAIEAMPLFIHWRSQLQLDQQVKNTLHYLGLKYPLIAITNGNIDIKNTELDAFFKFSFQADINNPKKPASHLFAKACMQLNIAPQQLLHIGDHPRSDIYGAQQFGAQTIYLTPAYGRSEQKPLFGAVPNWQISDINQLIEIL